MGREELLVGRSGAKAQVPDGLEPSAADCEKSNGLFFVY